MTGKVLNPFELFTDANGAPLEDGKIYIGVAGLDAETNPQAVTFKASGAAASQPIRTVAGYPASGGSPQGLVTSATYSITVRDADDVLLFSSLNENSAVTGLSDLGITASAAELNKLDGVTVTTAELNSVPAKSPIASPAFTGTPTAPTATSGTNTTQVATTEFVQDALVWEIIERVVVSSAQANVDVFWDTDGLEAVHVEISQMYPATDGVALYARTSTDGVSIDDGLSDYSWYTLARGVGRTENEQFAATLSTIHLAPSYGISNALTDLGVSGRIDFRGVNGGRKKELDWEITSAGTDSNLINHKGFGCRNSNDECRGIELYFSSGNIAEGVVTVYGLRSA